MLYNILCFFTKKLTEKHNKRNSIKPGDTKIHIIGAQHILDKQQEDPFHSSSVLLNSKKKFIYMYFLLYMYYYTNYYFNVFSCNET